MFIYLLIFGHTTCGILVPRAGIELGPSAVKAWSPNHWTTRESPLHLLFMKASIQYETGRPWHKTRQFYLPVDICMFCLSFLSPKSQRNPRIHVLCCRKIHESYKKAILSVFLGL